MAGWTPQKSYLFIDLRHIRCDDLKWLSPRGEPLSLIGERLREPAMEARADVSRVPRGIRLQAQKAAKTDPIPGNPRLSRVIHDGLYRSWYLEAKYGPGRDWGCSSEDAPLSLAICYVESKDAVEWSKPKKCRIHAPDQTGFDGFTFFIDPNAPASERYKAVYMAIPPASEKRALWEAYQRVHPRHRDTRLTADYITCMYGAVSPDGIHWKAIPDPLMVHKSDTDTTVYYDAWLDRYVMYTRLFWQERRWIGRAEAEDFRGWGPVSPLIWPRLEWALSDDIYTNGRTEYPGLPGYHLMFPMVYHRYTQASDVRLFASADGICWNEVPGGPVIAPGEPTEWDAEFIVAGKDLVPMGRDRVAIPYMGTPFPHKYPRWKNVLKSGKIGWAYWPKGRLCALIADEEGEFFTFPVTPSGRQLRLNVRTRRAGQVRVGLIAVPGQSPADHGLRPPKNEIYSNMAEIPGRTIEECDPIFGDSLSTPVRWKGKTDIGVGKGMDVMLHFKLRSAELFGFEFA